MECNGSTLHGPTTLGEAFFKARITEAHFEDENNQAVDNNVGDQEDPNVNDKQEVKKAEEIENVKDEEGKNVEDQHGAVRSIGLAIKSDVAYFGREVRDIGTLRVYELWKPSFVSRIKTRGLPHPSPNRPNKKLKPIIVEVIITKLEELKV
ncbi:hypothetical protein Tco_0961296 [Tanacetum coccineum]